MFSVMVTILTPLTAAFFFFHSPAQGPNHLPVLTTFIFIPILAAFVTLLFSEKYTRWINLIFSAAQLGIAFKVFLLYQTAVGGFQFTEELPWINGLGIHYALGVDGISVPMMILIASVYLAGILVSWNLSLRKKEFAIFFSLMVAGAAGAYLSLDLFFFFLFYELDILPMYLLIGIWGSGRKEYAAMKLSLYLLVGSAFLLIGFLAMVFTSSIHTFDIRILGDLAQTGFSPQFQHTWFPLLAVGFGILLALFPFHTWSPDGYASAPTAASMMNAGVLKTLGGYGLLRIALPALQGGAKEWLPFFAILAVINLLYASLVALKQKDIKYVVAYSSVAHCGYLVLGICAFQITGLNGSVVQMFSQGILTAFAFGLVGLIENRTNTRQWDQLGGLAALTPVIGGLFMAATMANVGLPGFSSFVAEFMVFLGSYQSGFHGGFTIFKILFPLAATTIVVGAIYYLRMIQNVFFGPVKVPVDQESIKDGTFIEILPLVLLLALSLLVGLYPKPWVDMINSSVEPLIDHIGGFR